MKSNKYIKELRKLSYQEEYSSQQTVKILTLINDLEDRDFNYLIKEINYLIKNIDSNLAKTIIKKIPEEKIEHFSKSISERFTDLIEAIPLNKSYLFIKTAAREMDKNDGIYASKIIKFIYEHIQLASFDTLINQAIGKYNGPNLGDIISSIPKSMIPNFSMSINNSILRSGNEDTIRSIPEEYLNLFPQSIGQRMIDLSPVNIREGLSTDSLNIIHAIPKNQIYHFIESIGLTIAKITNNLSNTTYDFPSIGLSRICYKYLDSILKHAPEKHRHSIVRTANNHIESSLERERLSSSITIKKWVNIISSNSSSHGIQL